MSRGRVSRPHPPAFDWLIIAMLAVAVVLVTVDAFQNSVPRFCVGVCVHEARQ